MGDRAPGGHDIERIVAPNPGPMTLEGTNSYVVGVDGAAFVIDPGPADRGHIEALEDAARPSGGFAGVLLTHDHGDHSAAAPEIDASLIWPPSSDNALASGEPLEAGPFEVFPTPGHSPDHVAFLLGEVCFCGDLVLGAGSTFVPPDGGSLTAYLDSLRRLRERAPELLCPGHGPWITDVAARIDEYLEHRLDRERKLVAALERGERSRGRLLDSAWDDVPAELRGAAAVVMQAHLEKLDAEGRLPASELAD